MLKFLNILWITMLHYTIQKKKRKEKENEVGKNTNNSQTIQP
jgi:hypothetical protein